MKKVIVIVVLGLILINTSQAGDIRDFKMEGISIGDSLLDHFSEKEIIKYTQIDQYPGSDKYIIVTINVHESFKKYDGIQIDYLKNDKKYIIASLTGGIYYYDNNISKCYKEQKRLNAIYSKIYTNAEIEKFEGKKSFDKSGKSKYTNFQYFFPSGDVLHISCDDWSEEMNNNNFPDALSVGYATKSNADFVINEAYK